jgi:hypothetical protein
MMFPMNEPLLLTGGLLTGGVGDPAGAVGE